MIDIINYRAAPAALPHQLPLSIISERLFTIYTRRDMLGGSLEGASNPPVMPVGITKVGVMCPYGHPSVAKTKQLSCNNQVKIDTTAVALYVCGSKLIRSADCPP